MSSDHLPDDDYDRLARYVSGEATAVERAETERWAAADADRRAALSEMQRAWRTPAVDPSWDVDAAWAKVTVGLRQAGRAQLSGHSVVSIASRGHWWRNSARLMQAAAAAVVLIGGAAVVQRLRVNDSKTGATLASTSISTRAGERRTVRLPDGSTVVLGVSSTLRTRQGYGDAAREVELDGEALFTVRHEARRPFKVHVGGTLVEDLGTEFAIRSYADSGARSSTVRVAVTSGSVAVHRGTSADTSVVLAPRDVATVQQGDAISVARGVDVTPFTAFASGRLIFVDAAFSDVVGELQRWYGIDVRVTDDAILQRHLTSTFDGETLDEVLRIIGLALDVRYEREGDRVKFMANGGMSTTRRRAPFALAEAGA